MLNNKRRDNIEKEEVTFGGQMVYNILGIGYGKSKDIMHHNYLMKD